MPTHKNSDKAPKKYLHELDQNQWNHRKELLPAPKKKTGGPDKNRILVQGQCTACHSSKLILQSHFDREKWVERIRWMQRTQKLWDLGESEPAVLTYLTNYYGPIKTPFDGRRLPLDTSAWYKQTGR